MARPTARVVAALCWLAVGGVGAAFAVARLVPLDVESSSRLVGWAVWSAFMVRTLTLHAGLGLLAVTLAALVVRAHRAGWAALALAVLLMGPTLWRAMPRGPQAGVIDGPTLTLAVFNLASWNPTHEAAIDAVLAAGADVVVLQEYTPRFDELCRARLAAAYPHRVTHPHWGFYGMAVYSRIPITGRVFYHPPLARPSAPQLRCTLAIAGRPVTLWCVHLLGPHHPGAVEHQRQFTALLRHLATERGPVIVAGDTNFTQYSDMATALTDAGYRDALDLAGRGLLTTWPTHRRGAWLLYPGVRIDHVYLSPDLTASAAHTGDTPGSDHRHVITTIGFARNAAARTADNTPMFPLGSSPAIHYNAQVQ